jgi:hypothetical protein
MSFSSSNSCSRFAIFLLASTAAITLVGCDAGKPIRIGGNYSPVTAEKLVRAEFSHRTGSEDFDFDWSFQPETFVITGDTIPPDLLTAMLGPEASGKRIEGTWKIRDGRIFFGVKTGEGNVRECSLPIYSTGVIRIETQEAQYVF